MENINEQILELLCSNNAETRKIARILSEIIKSQENEINTDEVISIKADKKWSLRTRNDTSAQQDNENTKYKEIVW